MKTAFRKLAILFALLATFFLFVAVFSDAEAKAIPDQNTVVTEQAKSAATDHVQKSNDVVNLGEKPTEAVKEPTKVPEAQ